jgi:hypothetical protein
MQFKKLGSKFLNPWVVKDSFAIFYFSKWQAALSFSESQTLLALGVARRERIELSR